MLTVALLGISCALGCEASQFSTNAGPSAPSGTYASAVPEAVPEHWMLAKMQPVDQGLLPDQAEDRVLSELSTIGLPAHHLPAEQLAAEALQTLDAGQMADAALWLSVASYRYRQEWLRLWDQPNRYEEDLFAVWNAETDVYGAMDYEEQLGVLARMLRGEGPDAGGLKARLASTFRNDLDDPDLQAQEELRRLRERGGPPTVRVKAKGLATAFLERLKDGGKSLRDRVWRLDALAQTPFGKYAIEALRRSNMAIVPTLCRDFAPRLVARRQEVVALLKHPHPIVRANAAVVLGMNAEPSSISDLETAWAAEKDEGTKLALAYALLRNGRQERVGDLLAGFSTCPAGVCETSALLLLSLPNDFRKDLDSEIFARLAGDWKQRLPVRLYSTRMMAYFARDRGLSAAARALLIHVAQEKNRDLLAASSFASSEDIGFSRELVLRGLNAPSPAYAPLLGRFSKVSTAQDLPLLRRLIVRFAAEPGGESDSIIDAVAKLSGVESERTLLDWIESYPTLRRHITYKLLLRPALDATTDAALFSIADPEVRLIASVVRQTPDAVALLQEALESSDMTKLFLPLELASLWGDPRLKPTLWSLVNFRSDVHYPFDAFVRHEAMGALLSIAILEAQARIVSSPNQEPPHATTDGGDAWTDEVKEPVELDRAD